MSKTFVTDGTNRTPWTDFIDLIAVTETQDAAGYKHRTEESREVCVTFYDGVSRAEYYDGMKAGVLVTAAVEIWEEDFEKERELEADGVRYRIGRVRPTGRGTLMLYLEEIVR